MADYKVGNLQIVFDTLNQTDEGFKKLASNLRAVQKAIAKIGDTDLKPFVANIKQITKSFTPLLTNISGASEGIIALNQAIQKVGASKLSKVAEEVAKLQQLPSDVATEFDNLNGKIDEGNEKLKQTSTALVALSKAQSEANVEFENLNRIINYNSYDKVLASVGGLAKAWRNLYTTYSQMSSVADKVTGNMFSDIAASRLQNISEQYFRQKEIVEQTNKAFREMEEQYRRSKMTVEELTIEEYRNVEAKRKQRIEFLEAALALDKAGENTEAYKKELAELTNQQEKNNKVTKKSTSGFSKLFASIKRIALYRLIRTALKNIASSITETAKAFAQVDDGVNNTMSQLTSSLSIIKLSFGATLLPILQMITPIVQEIGIAFANVANMVSQAMSTTGTYTKINTDYIKNYRDELEKTGSLLDFDKFRALSGGKGGLSDFLIPNQEVEEKNEKIIQLSGTIERITSIISSLWDIIKSGLRAIQPFVDDILDIVQDLVIPALKKVFEWIGKITKKIDELGLTKSTLYIIMGLLIGLGSYKIIKGILSLTSSINGLSVGLGLLGVAFVGALAIAEKWGDMSWWQRLIGIVGVATVAILGLAVAMGAFQSAWSLGAAAVGIIAGITAIVAAVSTAKNEASKPVSGGGRGFANGGVPYVGTLFYAGEAGAETVTVGSSGRTEVTNVQQMEQALYNALVRYGRENRASDGGAVNVYIDGQKTFEAVRRTANKRGLDFSRI